MIYFLKEPKENFRTERIQWYFFLISRWTQHVEMRRESMNLKTD